MKKSAPNSNTPKRTTSFFKRHPNTNIRFFKKPSPNCSERRNKQSNQIIETPSILVMHYTAVPLRETLNTFMRSDEKNGVSAHYTVHSNGDIYHHVDEVGDKSNAWHTGPSYWGISDINPYSI